MLQEVTAPETKHRKSVAFSEEATVMDANGEVTEAAPVEKETAESHSAGTYSISSQQYTMICELTTSFNRQGSRRGHRTVQGSLQKEEDKEI